MLVFTIETEPKKYFSQFIEIMKAFPPLNKLRKRQREVFAEILYHNYEFSKVSNDKDVINRLVFDYKTKAEIADKLKISKANLYNIYKELRKFEILTKDGKINPKFEYKYLQYPQITFKFRRIKN